MLDQPLQQRSGILSYSTGWVANGLSWSNREDTPFRFAVSSYIQEYKNHVDIVQKNEEGKLVCGATWEHCYPPTKVMFAPQKASADLIITAADYLRLWEIKEGPPQKNSDEKHQESSELNSDQKTSSKKSHIDSHVAFKTVFDSGKPNEFCFPVTSCDWNNDDPNIVGCCSVDTTVTIWDIESGKSTRLIAHDKDVYDIAFAKGIHTFASCGADGSVRIFDLREIEHCTILYESRSLSPLLRVAWDRVDQNYLSTFGVEGTEVIVIDIRFPAVPVGQLRSARPQPINSVCWAPNSTSLCSAGEDGIAYIWDLSELPSVAPKCILNYKGEHSINNISWSSQNEQWIAITTVRLRDMSGNVTQQKLHNRVFDAYEAKSLVFELITPEQQNVMRQYGTIPAQHPAGQPLLVDDWSDLVNVHRDDNLYQLLPRRAKNNSSYSVMRAICCSAGSPFTMDHRVDPIDYKFVFRVADMEVRNQFNAKNQDKVPPSIWFDGILSSPTDSGLVSFSSSLSPAHINNMAGTYRFLQEWSREPPEGDRHRQLKQMYAQLLSKRTHLFIGSSSVPGREILNYAKSKSVFIYAKKGPHYAFHA